MRIEIAQLEDARQVMTANKPAWHCYKSLGYHMEPYPHCDPHLDNCVFMVANRPAR